MDLFSNYKSVEKNFNMFDIMGGSSLFKNKVIYPKEVQLIDKLYEKYDMNLQENIIYLIVRCESRYIPWSKNLLYLHMPNDNTYREFNYLLYLYCKDNINVNSYKYLIYYNHIPKYLLKYLVYLISYKNTEIDPIYEIFNNNNIIHIHYMITHLSKYLYYPSGIIVLNSHKRYKLLFI